MAFCNGREDDGRGWQDDDWKDLITDKQEQEDVLFKCLDEDELEDVHESIVDELFVMQPMDIPLDLVERLSWDAACQGSDEEDKEAVKPMLSTLGRPLQVGIAINDNNVECGLMSPCSETLSPQTIMSSLIQTVLISPSVCQQSLSEPEHEVTSSIEPITEEEKQEEVAVHDSETCCWPPDVNSVLSSPIAKVSANPFATYQPAESREMDYRTRDHATSDNESHEDDQPSPVVSARRPSLLPRVSSIAQWRRQKSRTCSGAGSAGTPIALKSAPLKASLSSRSIGDEDDGDFSSDDEGFTPGRTSETECLSSSPWRRARQTTRYNFPSRRLSVNVSMRPTMMTKRLQVAKDKLNSGLHLLRSGSTVSTVMSEENYLESPVYQEIMSAPSGLYCESSVFSDKATATSLVSAASACTIDSNTHHPTRQQQLRAGVFKAAGLLNAASAEAARKLKSHSFRAPYLPTQKAASETEEEDPTASDHCGAIETYEA
ncbi:hypothetical protein KXD40_006579 [Peronospora effusa]|uniref:Uncharacterized protein n=1 Tax=Peronospora effusa TaxID=542832 RepID=A0A3M6VM95_9STRA|nr:hypothetical protein DD238_002878 [Peronospora effusa]RQM09874.1 hypothetical protein DD237_002095 [Peronospora effusa]UIZ25068.1 hypothetical protein KXD40_006579 [Peronospora effusa]CAI5719853.1 unnamed protein product [Peronospora effusa]